MSNVGIFGSTLMVVLIGIFAAADPETYKRGFLQFISSSGRTDARETIAEIGDLLRRWLVSQLVTMLLVGVSIGFVLVIMGVPGALLLGLQAGLLNFIPYLGPFLAAMPIGLAAAAQGMSVLLWILGLYIAIQILESYVLTPVIQRRAIAIPPVVILSSLMIFGTLFGPIGLALAAPLTAVCRVALQRLWLDTRV